MEKDGSGNSAGKDMELDALLSAADSGMLEAIRDNLDLDTGLAQILGGLGGVTPAGRPTGPAEAEPGGHTLDPVLACEVSGAVHKIPAPARPASHREPLYHPRVLITLALAVVTAVNIAVLCSLSHNHGALATRFGANAISHAFEPVVGERPAGQPRPEQAIVLADKVGASVSLRFAAHSAGLGGDPVISY